MISLIITVKNEHANLPQWLASIQAQTMQPDEIVIVDGGSTDGTWTWLQSVVSPHIQVYQKNSNIASGRNFAIEQTRGDIIAVADAGCYYEPTWLAELTKPILNKGAQFSATAFGPWLETGDSNVLYLLAAATVPAPTEFNRSWLPSSRSVAFKKAVWELVGGYPDWIPFGEDVIFDLKIKKQGILLAAVNQVLVKWRPRSSLSAYLKQLYNYTRSDGHGKLWYGRQVTRFLVYAGLIIGLWLALAVSAWWLIVIGVGACAYMTKFWRRFIIFSRSLPLIQKISGLCVLPVIIGLGDIAKMIGWLTGVLERWCGKIKYQPW